MSRSCREYNKDAQERNFDQVMLIWPSSMLAVCQAALRAVTTAPWTRPVQGVNVVVLPRRQHHAYTVWFSITVCVCC